MSRKSICTILSTLFLLGAVEAGAVQFNPDSLRIHYSKYAGWCSPEKIYLHMDRTYYAVAEDIWFMGYLSNASAKAVLPVSRYIYVEVLDKQGKSVSRVKIKQDEDQCYPGCLTLPDNLASGNYTVRAYSIWQMNRPDNYMFNQRIEVLGSKRAKEKEQTPDDLTDISFYPEGGRYFAGQKAVVGIKVMDGKGRSKEYAGWIYNESGEQIVPVATKHDGMSSFSFIPEVGRKYRFVGNDGREFNLPEPSASGMTINCGMISGQEYAIVRGVTPGNYYLFMRDASSLRLLSPMEFTGQPKAFKLPLDVFTSGINHFLLLDAQGTIVSERMFFIYDESPRRPVVRIARQNERPSARELLRTGVTLTDAEGNPLDGKFSVSVVRGSFKGRVQDDGIESYMNLSSELSGKINNPSYYFDSNVSERERKTNIDLLMMIQGWKYYDMPAILASDGKPYLVRHMKEYMQEIHGYIERTLGSKQKLPKNFVFTVMVPKLNMTNSVQVSEASGFIVDSLDFQENTDFLININRKGLGADYSPKWRGDKFASPYMYYPAPGMASAQKVEEKIPLVAEFADVDTLQAAVVSADQSSMFGDSINGRMSSSEDIERYKDRTLIDYVKLKAPSFTYENEYMVNKRILSSGGSSQDEHEDESTVTTVTTSEDVNAPRNAVRLVVDDMEQQWWMFDNVYMEDVEAISISTSPDFLYGAMGGLVEVKFKSGITLLRNSETRPSLLYFVPLGYQKPRYFYSPRYDKGDPHDTYDHRNTIYWNPSVKVSGGKAMLEFCNSDQMDFPFIIRIEGLTSDGRPFSLHSTLDYKE